MKHQRGFLLLELIAALFLLALCITLSVTQCGYIEKIAYDSLQKYKILLLVQNTLEKSRASLGSKIETHIVDPYTLECAITQDHALTNFLHIHVTVYHKGESVGTWFSGVALPYEA